MNEFPSTPMPRGHQLLVESRTAADIIYGGLDIWWQQPSFIRAQYAQEGLNIELTDKCTVGCNFCRTADQGKIQSRMSWDTFRSIIDDAGPNPNGQYDFYYWGTDPLDWKGEKEGIKLSFVDIATYALDAKRQVFISTALPIGEELTFISLIDTLEHSYPQELQKEKVLVRLSVTPQNELRVANLLQSLTLHGYTLLENQVYSPDGHALFRMDSRSEGRSIKKTGDVLAKQKSKFSLRHLQGPTCRDGLVMNPHGVDAIITMPHCATAPAGHLRIPLANGILPNPMYTYKSYELPVSFLGPNQHIENHEFVLYARKTLELVNRLFDQEMIVSLGPPTYPEQNGWCIPTYGGPCTKENVEGILTEIDEYLPFVAGDIVLNRALSQSREELLAILDDKYQW